MNSIIINNIGKVITFYSFKGGVGRTMALSNVATLLSKWGKKILIIDFDLEAPGVEKYFTSADFVFSKDRTDCFGVVDILTSFSKKNNKISWQDCIISATSTRNKIKCDIISAGKDDKSYATNLQNLNWDFLFEECNLGEELEIMRNEWIQNYDYVLIDSRTGISDIGGICTIYLPDIIAFLFTTNDASLNGCIDVIKRAKESRNKMPYDRSFLVAIPIPSRDESRTEFESSQRWKNVFEEKLNTLYNDWLPKDISIKSAIDLLKVPYIPYWSFGDRLPVIEEGTSENSIGYSYEKIALLINNDFDWSKVKTGLTIEDIDTIIEKKESKLSSKLPNMEIENYIIQRVDDQIRYYSIASSRNRLLYLTIMTFQIFLGAYLPILTRVSLSLNIDLQISLIGAFIIILTGLQGIGNFKEKWVLYRKTAEKIKQEKFKFLTIPDKYKEEEFFNFVRKIEEIFASENNEWIDSAKKENYNSSSK
ncbi:uncharacterized protein DUF4231 [Flavobacterium sp. 90]|uniref:DUF4231 domain-containing protein n=1 Tax=unclassified Flavobacterium TaxID=196869 RepID=UPI000EB50D74|nr:MULTISPECIES: DUF4231 domain-containing protein [unclassified Flavobacterium]RKR05592.1 uncharacterized protein DUF4231 [Flavobacterium sp. 81]TCK56908.1 uncharacterized protein DUF4231 [Flavobacterium sp. 90]